MKSEKLQKNDRREIFGWMLYDWANSAFFTAVIGVLVGPYLLSLTQKAVGEDGVVFDLYFFNVTAKGLFSFCTAVSTVSLVVFLPILGAIADYTHLKKRLMSIFCYLGVLAGAAMFFITESYLGLGILIILSNMAFAAANVFYNAFLIDVTSEDKRDKISSYGYGLGYIGGVVMLLLCILLLNNAEALGITTGFAARLSFLAASLWWGIFGAISFYMLKTRRADKEVPAHKNLL